MAETAAERKRKEREVKRKEGLIPVELWLHPDDKEVIKDIVMGIDYHCEMIYKMAAKINKRSKKK